MTWFKVDDGFWSHPKVMGLSDAAIAMWVRAGSYACQHLTDGVIVSRVTHAVGTRDAAEELVDAGLWAHDGDGYRFHDWAEYQETSGDVKKRRDQWKQRQKRAREKANVTQDVTRDSRRESLRESPSPVPSRPDHHSSTKSETRTRAHALPDVWRPNDTHRRIAAERGIDCDAEAEQMRDWAAAKGETAKDWDARFRNWLRRATPPRQQPGPHRVGLQSQAAALRFYEETP